MGDCLFCRIVRRAIPADIVAEDEQLLAFADSNPQAPTHVLIVPKTHLPSLAALNDANAGLMAQASLMANRLATQQGIAQTGYRVVVNCGPQAGQSIAHLHLHLLGGRAMAWPPG
jgi:histidine triad (HIT) family protein